MTERSYDKRPDEIEDEIARTRADMDVTLDAIQRKLSPGELVDQAMSYVKQNGGGEMMAGVGNLVRDNPIPVALIGAGLAWLLYSASRPDHEIDESHEVGPQAGLGQGAYGTAYASADDVDSRSNGGAAARAADALGGAYGAVASRGRRLGDYARGGWEHTRDGYGSLAAERPLMLGAIGFAAGAALGLLIPATRSENEMLGDYRDQLFEQAQVAGREQVQKAQSVANEAWRAAKETAKEEASKQGLASTSQSSQKGAEGSWEQAKGPSGAPQLG